MKDISIIIVSWNAQDLLRSCLNSIQTSCGSLVLETIVVDNASSDGSPEMVAEKFPDVKLIRLERNSGFAGGNNIGIQHATGTWLALINSDVVVQQDCLQNLMKYLEEHPQVGLVGPKIFGTDGRLQGNCRRLPTLWNTICRVLALDNVLHRWSIFSGREMRHWNHENEASVEVLSGCFWMARKIAVEMVGPLDERFFFYAEDVDWCKRFADAGWEIMFLPQATAIHHGGGSSANSPFSYSIEMLKANLAYWKKHRGTAGEITFYLLCVAHHAIRIVIRGIMVRFGHHGGTDLEFKFKRSQECLKWLLSGRLALPAQGHQPGMEEIRP